MTRQTTQMIAYFAPDRETVQTGRCLALLNTIIGKSTAMKIPAPNDTESRQQVNGFPVNKRRTRRAEFDLRG